MAAKYYIYRNLNKGGFSVKYRGLVVDRPDAFSAKEVEFRVSKAGQERARKEQRRNVHAYLVCDKYNKINDKIEYFDYDNFDQAYYHPLQTDTFVRAGTKKILRMADNVVAFDGRVYVPQ